MHFSFAKEFICQAFRVSAASLSSDERRKVPGSRSIGNGRLSGQIATAQRTLLPCAGCAVLLEPWRWVGCCGHGGNAPLAARKPSASRPDLGGLSQDDGLAAEVSGQRRVVARVD